MTTLRTLLSLSVTTIATACANPGAVTGTPALPMPADEHAAHQAEASASAPMAAMDPRMKAMHDMHQKMMNAKTPEERQALMADHMKAMQDGMAMMRGMEGKASMAGMAAKGGMGGMSDPKGMPADMASHHKMMEQRMELMQMMMEMMMDRMPASPATS